MYPGLRAHAQAHTRTCLGKGPKVWFMLGGARTEETRELVLIRIVVEMYSAFENPVARVRRNYTMLLALA